MFLLVTAAPLRVSPKPIFLKNFSIYRGDTQKEGGEDKSTLQTRKHSGRARLQNGRNYVYTKWNECCASICIILHYFALHFFQKRKRIFPALDPGAGLQSLLCAFF